LSTLNVNVPRFYCFLRKQFLYDGEAHQGEFIHACVFGAASIQGRALGFHVLTENGAAIWRVPLHALCHKQEAPTQPLDWLQFWDCFSYEVTAITFDWYGSEDSEEAGDGGHGSTEQSHPMVLPRVRHAVPAEAGLLDQHEDLESGTRDRDHASVLLRHGAWW
jgi:hypothetical protein